LKELRRKGPLYQQAMEDGALGREWFGGEIRLLQEAMEDSQSVMDAVFRLSRKSVQDIGRLYQAEEQWFKLAKYLHNLEKGMTRREAAEDALKWTFDYSQVSRLTRGARETVMPFATWFFKMVPVITESLVRYPWRWAGLYLAHQGLLRHSLDSLNISDKEWERIRSNLPKYVRKGSFILLPWRDRDGRLQWLDLTYVLPWGDIVEMGQRGPLGLVLQSPLWTIPAGLYTGHDFIGRPLWYEWEEPKTKVFKGLDFVYKQLAPSFFLFSYDWIKGQEAGLIPRLENLFKGRPLLEPSEAPGRPTPGQYLASQVGLKTFARSKAELRRGKVGEILRQRREIMSRAKREAQRYPERREEARRRAMENLRRLMGR